MARPPLTEQQKQAIKNDIRKAALRLKDQRDSKAITVRAVAAEAGVSVGTFYAYYENLSELAQSTWQEPVDRLREKIKVLARETADPLQRIQKVLECYVLFEKEERTAFRSVFLFVRHPDMTEPEKAPVSSEMFYTILRDAVREGQTAGSIREGNAGDMAQLLWASVHGAMALPYHMDRYRFHPSQKMAKKMVNFLIEGIAVNDALPSA